MLDTAETPEAEKPHEYFLPVFRGAEHKEKNPSHFTQTHTHTHMYIYIYIYIIKPEEM